MFFLLQNRDEEFPFSPNNNDVSWMFDYNTKVWQVSGTPPDCPEPLGLLSPIDVSLASAVLYPGQERGGDYKPHGGFRFDNRDTNDIELRAIMDGYVLKASRYDDEGETQNFMFYVNDCGIMVMHDHFFSLSPKLKALFDKLPVNKDGDSRTTFIEPKVYIKKGELLASEVGYKNFKGSKNIFVDFGLYDLRKTNGIVYSSAFRADNPSIDEYGAYALCWLDYLKQPDKSIIMSLPGADGKSGKSSDYCK